MERHHTLNIRTPHIKRKEENTMGLEAYFAMILLILSAVSFITIALLFLYMIYGKEEAK
jgi:hypothetical protein